MLKQRRQRVGGRCLLLSAHLETLGAAREMTARPRKQERGDRSRARWNSSRAAALLRPVRGMLMPVEVPETRNAKSGDLHSAYQVAGSARRDILFPTTLWSPLDLVWADPVAARGLWRLASMVTPGPTPSYLGVCSIAIKPAISGANCSASIRLKLATSDVTQSTTQRLPLAKKKAM
jgi:hypothetical protein